MKVTKLTPIITTTLDLETVKQFYQRYFAFTVTFHGAGYLGLKSPGGGAELAFMRSGEGEQPFRGEGLTLTLDVTNVDEEHDRLRAAGVAIVQPPKDNPWGDRSMIVRDPVGAWLYICHRIPISTELKQFLKE